MSALPELLDCAKLADELGVTRAAAETMMRQVPVVKPDGLRKTYVRRDDIDAYLRASEHHSERRVA